MWLKVLLAVAAVVVLVVAVLAVVATMQAWAGYGHNNFLARAVWLFVDVDKALGGELEPGLAAMKSAAEASARS